MCRPTCSATPAPFLQDNMPSRSTWSRATRSAIHLPPTVVLEVVEADPVVKGQTASSSYKPAKLSNGVKTSVPPFIETGEKIVVTHRGRAATWSGPRAAELD